MRSWTVDCTAPVASWTRTSLSSSRNCTGGARRVCKTRFRCTSGSQATAREPAYRLLASSTHAEAAQETQRSHLQLRKRGHAAHARRADVSSLEAARSRLWLLISRMRPPGGSLAVLVRPAAIVAVAGSVDYYITVLGQLSLGHHEEGRINIASFRSTRATTIDYSTPKCAGGCFRKCVVDACRGGRDRGAGRVQSCSRASRSDVSGGKKFANWQVAVRSGRLLVSR